MVSGSARVLHLLALCGIFRWPARFRVHDYRYIAAFGVDPHTARALDLKPSVLTVLLRIEQKRFCGN